jgi:4-amino-4-deoxychorismate lyase
MYQFIETIKIKNGKFQNLSFHLQRMKNTIMDFFNIDFITNIDNLQIPEIYINDVVKCRIIYSSKIDSIEFLSYEIKKINKLKIKNLSI